MKRFVYKKQSTFAKYSLAFFDKPIGLTFLFFIGTLIFNSSLIREGVKNSEFDIERRKFIKSEIRNLDCKTYSYLDIEADPEPLVQLTEEEKFNKEFKRMTHS